MPSIKEIYNSIGEVELNAESINLNVDGLEALASTQQADVALIKADLANGVTINQPVAVTDNSGSLTVDGTVTANAGTGTFAVSSTQLPSSLASDRLKVDGSGVVQPSEIRIGGSPAQATNPLAVQLSAGGLAVTSSNPLSVSATSLPLPSGAATSANQSTANTSLSNIDTDLGAQADASATTDTGTFSLISLFKRLLSRITSLVPANLTVTSTRLLVDGSGVTQPVSGTLTTNPNMPSGAVTNRSSTITTGGTSQQVAASNTSRKYFLIQNISDTDMYLGVGYTPTTTTGILLAKSGSGITFESGFIPTSAINVLCATTGKAFVALEG